MKVALFNHIVSPRSPAGSCDLKVLEALGNAHDITVFAGEFARPATRTDAVTYVPVPAIGRPRLASFLVYLLGGCVSYARVRLSGERFDVVQATDGGLPIADVCYAHFCHRAFLVDVWPRLRTPRSLRTLHTWLDHVVRSGIEAVLVRRSRVIVVPSEGLRRDFIRLYGSAAHKVTVIPNTVELARLSRPSSFDGAQIRRLMTTGSAETAFVFVALGHFERKGLPELLEALATHRPRLDDIRVWIIGGEPGLVRSYRTHARERGVVDLVRFAGRIDDVRPFLWAADAFVAPSHYEAFSLSLLEAAAAGLPLVATSISGADEVLEDGVNGLVVQPDPNSIARALQRFLALDPASRRSMGDAARRSVETRGPGRFAAAWQALYASLEQPSVQSMPRP